MGNISGRDHRSAGRGPWGIILGAGLVLLAAVGPRAAAAAEGRVFVIGNYPVEAHASDAVKAKEQAIQDGQQAAFRSLLKRIVPVTSYGQLKAIKATPAAGLIDGFSVRSERNSSTQYIASYDFSFQPEAVQRLLDDQGIPYLDKAAPRIVIVPMYRAGNQPQNVVAEATDTWTYAWRALDLTNTLTPATLAEAKREIHPDTLKAELAGDRNAHRVIAGEYKTSLIVLAVLEPSADGKKATVTLTGEDAVGPLRLVRSYRLDGDLAYTSELAAIVGLGVLEGRWKAANGHLMTASAPQSYGRGGFDRPDGAVTPQPGGAPPPGTAYGSGPSSYPAIGTEPGGGGMLKLSVTFRGMGEWQQISQRLAATPGVGNLDVEGLSARGARVALSFPGGPDALARALSAQGLSLRSGPDGLLLTAR